MNLNRRETHRQQIQRTLAFARADAFGQQTLMQLRMRRQELENVYNRFVEEHALVVEVAEGENAMNVQNEMANNVAEVFLDAMSAFEDRMQQLKRENEEVERVQMPAPPPQQQNPLPRLADFRLESIRVSNFSGDYASWNEWRALYDSLIHNQERLSDTEKFHYLKKSLSGAAGQVLSGWHTTGDNYGAAYNALVQVYDNSYRIIMAHLDSLQKMPKGSQETHEGLRIMIDTANRAVRQLEVAGSPVEYWDHFMVYTLVSRMPPRTLTQWETTQDLENMPTLEEVLRFLERRARGIINLNVNQNSNSGKPKENKPNDWSTKRENRAENPSSSLKCFKCNGSHPIYRCEEVLKKSIAEREKIVRSLKLCKNCFRKDHEAGTSQCKAGKCRVCKKEFHNSILCPTSKGNNIAVVSTNEDGSSSTNLDF